MQKITPFGSWKSPITADLIARQSVRFGDIVLDGKDIYWIEGRPAEGGRNVIVCLNKEGQKIDILPAPYNARSCIHEYGGGAFTVHDGIIYFSNFQDQRLYRINPGEKIHPITPEGDLRYADGIIDRLRNRLICVREDHTRIGSEPINAIVAVDLEGKEKTRVLITGNDFYSSPCISPDRKSLAWLTWNHPNMPWDGTELWLAEIREDGIVINPKKVAGGISESIFQPEWSPDGILYFISDVTGWWNLHRFSNGKIERIINMEAEFGEPQWVFGLSTYGFISKNQIISAYNKKGIWSLTNIDLISNKLTEIKIPYTDISHLKANVNYIVFQASSYNIPSSVVKFDAKLNKCEVLQHSTKISIDPKYISEPKMIEFTTGDDLTSYGFYYPTQNNDYKAPTDVLPPLIVMTHGGPTSCSYVAFDLEIQYWTSRGFAVLDVNYGGSTGFGRKYRERLKGNWGIVDVDDCVNGAQYLVKKGLVDGNRLIIRGGSAGGYTTLAALVFRDVFKAGASYYGVSDLEALAKETHKFESRYLDCLIGPYPETRERYRERSPINYSEKLSAPIIFFQGLEDKVVLPSQAESMVKALRKKGITVALILFEGEQHGFRKAENIKRALEVELFFYSRVFGFKISDNILDDENKEEYR